MHSKADPIVTFLNYDDLTAVFAKPSHNSVSFVLTNNLIDYLTIHDHYPFIITSEIEVLIRLN